MAKTQIAAWYNADRVRVKHSVVLAEWAATRAPSALKKQAELRRFEAAQGSRLNYGWTTSTIKLDAELRYDLVPLRARARDLSINNDYARKFLQMVSANVVGANGFALQSQVSDPNGASDTLARRAIEDGFWRWSMAGECETSGKMGFSDFCRLYIRTAARDGEVLVRRVRDRRFAFGYRLQLLDIDRLDILHNELLSNGNTVRMGVELDTWGAPVAYWLLSRHPGENMNTGAGTLKRERIPAAEIFHCFTPERPEQTRGFPWMAASMMRMNMLHGYEEAAITAARTGAAKMGFFVSPDGSPSAIGQDVDDEGNFVMEADPGSFGVLPQGYDFKPWSPEYPTQNYDSFVKSCLRGIASGLGVAYNSLANDLEGVNFSSIRSGVIEERENWMVLQNWMIETFLRPMFNDWLESALLKGALVMPNGSPLPAGKLFKFGAHAWQGRRWQWVDPLKDIEAARLAIKTGVSSPQIIAAQQGVDLEDVIGSIAQFEQLVAASGATLIDYGIAPPRTEDPAPQEQAMKDLISAVQRLAEREQPAPSVTVNNAPPAVEFRQGDTTINVPEREVNLEATINAPEVRAGDVHVDVPPAQVVINHPHKTIETIGRDAANEITTITREVVK